MECLAKRLAQGDSGAWEQLYEEYKRGVVGLCLGYLHNREEALDAAEEAFLKALKNAHRIKKSGNVRAWLYTIAANTCKDMIRKRNRGQAWLKKWISGNKASLFEPSLEHSVNREQIEDQVRQAIASLENTYRIPLILRYYENMDYDEIAEVLTQIEGEPVKRGTVASRLNRAKQQLKLILQGSSA